MGSARKSFIVALRRSPTAAVEAFYIFAHDKVEATRRAFSVCREPKAAVLDVYRDFPEHPATLAAVWGLTNDTKEIFMASDSTKNPNEEAEHPAPMPKDQQGQGGKPQDRDPEGQQGGHHRAKMAVHSDSPPGMELDGKAHVIPIDERTEGDKQKALKGRTSKPVR